MNEPRYVLTLSCPDGVGIVAAVSGFWADHRGWILESSHHADQFTKTFFLRQEIIKSSLAMDEAEVRRRFADVAERFDMTWKLWDTSRRKRVAILVSKYDHCLWDLIYRWRSGEMDFDLVAVISNHEDSRDFVQWNKVPFHHLPMNKDNREQAFVQLDALLAQLKLDTIVLARFMQILPPWLCDKYPNRILNIHHSFLPSFVGARPYHQAHARGVKFVGATCHYVTGELDAGPIVEQDAVRTDHADSVEEMIRIGRDVEKAVLARGMHYHLQNRVIVHEGKTVVFT